MRMTCQIFGLYLLFLSIAFSYWGATEYSVTIFKQVFPRKTGGSSQG